MSRTLPGLIFALLALLWVRGSVHAQSAKGVPARVAEVQRLTQAGRLEDAAALLRDLDVPIAVRGRLSGLIALERPDYAAAAEAFAQAKQAETEQNGEADPQLSLYLAHAYLKLERFKEAIRAAEAAGSLADELVGQPLVLAHALRGAGRYEQAFSVLTEAAAKFRTEPAPRLELVALASARSLRTLARKHGAALLRLDVDRDTVLALIHALHRDPLAMPMLEQASARFSRDAEVRAHLAHGYVAQGNWYAAGLLFEHAVMLGGDYAFEAADQFRLAGASQRALAMNGRVGESARRVRQRLSILFAAGEMARVVALSDELRRLNLGDDAIHYRLAYAHFALHQTEHAARVARKLLGTDYEAQAKALLGRMGRSAVIEAP